ncbi:unnamed protein product [Penicillium palitans]
MSAISIGCWTCRVRHKKCDITIPFCRECSDRNVHCHGYGPKPTWMDGASEEKKERVRIKTAINQHVRRVRKMQNRTKRALLPQADKETQPHTNSGINASTAFDTEEDSNILPSASLELLDRPSSQDGIFDLQAASLLMHYFDQVFAWQFPYFRSTSPLGNRGWLLYLLMKRGPLYHAVLSLSSLHQSAILGSEEEYQQRERVLEHHSRALREFCKFMCEERGKLLDNNARLAEFLACSLILISCEVFRGAEHNWLLHLDAVISVMHSLSPKTIFDARYTSQTVSPISSQDRPQKGLEFLLATMVSLDLFACLSTGRVPQLPYQQWLCTPEIQIAGLLSCENWVMIIIGDLACFGEWKEVQEKEGILNISELPRRGAEIKDRLTTGIEKLDLTRDVSMNHYHISKCINVECLETRKSRITNWLGHTRVRPCLSGSTAHNRFRTTSRTTGDSKRGF